MMHNERWGQTIQKEKYNMNKNNKKCIKKKEKKEKRKKTKRKVKEIT